MLDFQILHQDLHSKARTGIFQTAHGSIETPIFMPVGTLGSVKGVSPQELEAIGTQIILANTYQNIRVISEKLADTLISNHISGFSVRKIEDGSWLW